MGLIKKISEEIALRIEGKSLYRKKAQENIKNKRALEQKQKELVILICGYTNNQLEQNFCKQTELEKIYGKTMIWKTDNRKFMNIDLETDYDMVKRVYDSEDILNNSKEQVINK